MSGIPRKKVSTDVDIANSAEYLHKASRLNLSAHSVDIVAMAPQVEVPLISSNRASSKRLVI